MKKKKYIDDDEVLAIMHRNELLRPAVQYPDRPQMSDEEFLRRLHDIVPGRLNVVNTAQAAAIYNLRADYQQLPKRVRQGKPHTYVDNSVRLQVRSGRLHPLTPDEQLRIFDAIIDTTSHRFLLTDVLEIGLLRWPSLEQKPKRKPGRPRKQSPTYAVQKAATDDNLEAKIQRLTTLAQQSQSHH